MMRNPEQTIGNLIDKQSVTILGSVDEQGFPYTKAMYPPRERIGIRTFYFTTNTSSLRVEQFAKNPKASIYFYDKRFFRSVLLLGTVEILTDATIKEKIWHDGDERFYPLGVTDPDYCVLRFTAEKGRYLSNFKNEDFNISEE
ncbi:pyridoxamine 5'-phosphate oxidase family protein [Oscillospiraceae bacterium PP1C4]